jgi:hypothetical protein
MQFDIRRRYHPMGYFGFDKLTTNGFLFCHAEFVVVERSILGGEVNKAFHLIQGLPFSCFSPPPGFFSPDTSGLPE